MTTLKITSFFSILLLLCAACNNDKGPGVDPCTGNFDQEALFRHLADNMIIPAYENLDNRVDDMQTNIQAFLQNPTITTLDAARAQWEGAYLAWQRAEPYEFGPAREVFLCNSLNNFPLNAAQVDQNIGSGIYDFDNPEAFDKGFPALDYLLFGIGADDEAIVTRYTTDSQAGNYRKYLGEVVGDIADRIEQTLAGWTTGGYRETFIQNTGTAAGSSLSLIVNNLNEHYEILKRDRIGIPSGVLTLGEPNPDKVEAFFSGRSLLLAREALETSRRFYRGNPFTSPEGPGLDNYLDAVNAEKNGRPLNEIILEQYEAARLALAEITPPLQVAVDTETDTVINAYNELTKLVVNLKTDLPAALCVAITYVDNPSDSD
jgi:predicted lipoprotein